MCVGWSDEQQLQNGGHIQRRVTRFRGQEYAYEKDVVQADPPRLTKCHLWGIISGYVKGDLVYIPAEWGNER